MKIAARLPCRKPGCYRLAMRGKGYCERHYQPQKWTRERKPDLRPSAAKRGYDKAHQQARKYYLARHPVCVVCGRPATVLDHRTPFRGDKTKRDDPANWQSMCRSCHGRKSRTETLTKLGGDP